MSDADSSWFLRHRDGVEHGPFRLADIVTAAKAGNVAADTCVRHDVHTQGQWVFATRVQPVAAAMPPATEKTPPSKQTPSQQVLSQRPTQGAPSRQPMAVAQSSVGGPSGTDTDRNASSATPPATASAASVSAGLGTAIRTQRVDSLPVPKTFLSAAQTLFIDFRFQRFITPWIVEILWSMSLIVAILAMASLGYMMFIGPSVSAPDSVTTQGSWRFEPLADQSLPTSGILAFATCGALIAITILCLRVVFELIIVFFRVGGDIVELRKFLRQKA